MIAWIKYEVPNSKIILGLYNPVKVAAFLEIKVMAMYLGYLGY